MKKNLKIKKVILFCSLVVLVIIIYKYLNSIVVKNKEIDFYVLFSFAILFIVSIINISKEKKPYSLNKTYWYFNLIFFTIAPITQYISNYHVWGYVIDNDIYFKTNVFILLGNIAHIIVYGKDYKYEFSKVDGKKIYYSRDIVLLIISLVCFGLLVANVGFSNLFLRATNVSELSDNKMLNTIFSCFLKAVPVYCFTIMYETKKKLNIFSIITILIVAIMNFPVSTTRFWMGAIFIGIILIVLVKNNKQSRLFDLIMVSTFTIIFPIAYYFHFYSFEDIVKTGLIDFNISSSYLAIDYDAYSIFSRAIIYVNSYGTVFGKQLIGTLLFFIPRAIWSTKPRATGEFIATSFGQRYTNISCPFMAEGYINFGIIGLVVFEVLLAVISKKLDKNYWSENCNKIVKMVYPYLIGLLLFYERGALHHAVVYTFCFMLPAAVIAILNIFYNGVLKRKEEPIRFEDPLREI